MLLIADDLTGACDAGVQFARYGADVVTAIGPESLIKGNLPEAQLLAVNTASRLLPVDQAAQTVRLLSETLARQISEPGLIIKKIDSSLRGNLGAELAVIMTVFRLPCAFVAPAWPEMGRTVVNGEMRINGQHLKDTAFARDPANPVNESSVVRMLQNQGLANVALVPAAILAEGEKAVNRYVNSLLARGSQYLVFDSSTSADLDLVARIGMNLPKQPLFTGCAGIAAAIAKIRFASLTALSEPERSQNTLVVCGSAHEASLRQVAVLQKAGIPVFQLAEDFEDPDKEREIAGKVLQALATGSVAVAAPEKRIAGAGLKLSESLARITISVLGAISVKPALCIAGGETAFAILARLAKFMRLLGEIEQGTVWARLPDDLTIVTKAGGFGNQDALLRVVEFMGKADE